MSARMPGLPTGHARHQVSVVVLSAEALPASIGFYRRVFGWRMRMLNDDIATTFTPSGPSVTLRRYGTDGGPPVTPFIQVTDIDQTLADVVRLGGTVTRPPYQAPLAGRIARFADPSGTIFGLTSAAPPGALPPVAMPLGANPRPIEGTVCDVEIFAADITATARFFRELFGWETIPTAPQFAAFDPGVGVAGIWQSHTPSTPALAYIYVADVAATLRAVEDAGGERRGEPVTIPGMSTFGYFVDPSGVGMGLMGG